MLLSSYRSLVLEQTHTHARTKFESEISCMTERQRCARQKGPEAIKVNANGEITTNGTFQNQRRLQQTAPPTTTITHTHIVCNNEFEMCELYTEISQ